MINFENIIEGPGVYCIECLDNKSIYLGSSEKVRERLEFGHFGSLRRGDHGNLHLQRAFLLYGEDAFIVYVLEYCEIENCYKREQYYLDTLLYAQEYIQSGGKDKRFLQLGFNLRPTADGPRGWKATDEQRKQNSEIKKKQWQDRDFIDKQKAIRTPEWNEKRIKKSKEAKENDPSWKDRVRESFEKNGSRRKMFKPIVSYNRITGLFEKEYSGVDVAAKELGIDRGNLRTVLCGRKRYIHDLVFKYKTENYPLQIEPVAQYADMEGRKKAMKEKIHAVNSKAIICTDPQGHKKEYSSAAQAARELKIDSAGIRLVLYGKCMHCHGYSFKYKDYTPRKYNKQKVAQ